MPGVLKGEPVTLAAEAEVRREVGRSQALPQETDRSDQEDGLARKRDAWLARGLGVADRVTTASTQSRSGAFRVARWPRRVERPLGGSEAWTPARADYTNSEASGTYMVLKPVGPGDPGSKRRYGSTGALLVKASETEWGAFQ